MEAASSLMLGHAFGKVVDFVGRQFHTQVISRWSKWRASEFFEEFCRQVDRELNGSSPESLSALIDGLMEDETKSALMFDAYRRVSLSKSKTIGPRLIAILTAQLVLQDRCADEFEEEMFEASEKLSDSDLRKFAAFVREHLQTATPGINQNWLEASGPIDQGGHLTIPMHVESTEVGEFKHQSNYLHDVEGGWAARCETLGMLSHRSSTRHTDKDFFSGLHRQVIEERHAVFVSKAFVRFAQMVDQVASPDPSESPHQG